MQTPLPLMTKDTPAIPMMDPLSVRDGDTLVEKPQSLVQARGCHEWAVPVLLENLDHADPVVRQATIATLGRIGLGAEQVVPKLLGCLKDPEIGVRHNAAAALGLFDIEVLRRYDTAYQLVNAFSHGDHITRDFLRPLLPAA